MIASLEDNRFSLFPFAVQVREVRSELQKYGGEDTGIRSHVTKSVRLR